MGGAFLSLGGNDVVYGHGGVDYISPGAGHDTVYGGPGNDQWLYGDEGTDDVYGQKGGDHISIASFESASNTDRASGGGGNDYIGTQDGYHDMINCGKGTDKVFYDVAKDTVKACEMKNP